jgi:hypothetical protein
MWNFEHPPYPPLVLWRDVNGVEAIGAHTELSHSFYSSEGVEQWYSGIHRIHCYIHCFISQVES